MSLSVFTCNRIWISARPDITYLLLQPTLQLKQTMSGPVMKLFWKCWLFHLQIWLKLWLCKKNIYQKCIGNTTEDKIYWMTPNYITSIMNSALFLTNSDNYFSISMWISAWFTIIFLFTWGYTLGHNCYFLFIATYSFPSHAC